MKEVPGLPLSASILVVANDTGGAQILAALMRDEHAAHRWVAAAVPGSPADRLFRHCAPGCPVIDLSSVDPAALFSSVAPDVLLTGTSLYNTELPLLREAKHYGIRTISVLDHWINYRERFGFPADDWRGNLPDVVAATDRVAVQLARDAGFPHVEPLKNYYLAGLLNNYTALPRAEERDILLLSQVVPFDSTRARGIHQAAMADQEHRMVKEFLLHFGKLAGFLGVERLVVRLHPAQPGLLYEELRADFPALVVEPASSCELVHSLRRARIVAGCSSMALFTATALGRETYSLAGGEAVGLPAVGRYIFASVEDILTGKCTLSPFGNSVYLDDDYGISRLLP